MMWSPAGIVGVGSAGRRPSGDGTLGAGGATFTFSGLAIEYRTRKSTLFVVPAAHGYGSYGGVFEGHIVTGRSYCGNAETCVLPSGVLRSGSKIGIPLGTLTGRSGGSSSPETAIQPNVRRN